MKKLLAILLLSSCSRVIVYNHPTSAWNDLMNRRPLIVTAIDGDITEIRDRRGKTYFVQDCDLQVGDTLGYYSSEIIFTEGYLQ